MNIVTYNLRLGGNARARTHWRDIFDATNADIFLSQETRSPDQYLVPEDFVQHQARIHWAGVGKTGWGSAVFVRSGCIRALEIAGYGGYVTGVEVAEFAWRGATKRLRVFSLHVPAPYKRPMNEILDRIAGLPDADACDHVIGGDFNLTTGVRHPGEKRQMHDLWLLERLRKEFNLMNCWQVANPNRDLPQTLRWGRDKTESYHCDAIFVPAGWYRYLDGCEVLTSPVWDKLSDHNPVVAYLSS